MNLPGRKSGEIHLGKQAVVEDVRTVFEKLNDATIHIPIFNHTIS